MGLIFIVSQPRSGSTLLQSIISNNEYVSTATEPWLLLPFLSIYNPSGIQAPYNYSMASRGIGRFLKSTGGEKNFNSQLNVFLTSLYSNLKSSNTRYILDKTPRYYEILPHIKEVFPDAKFIILKRNPFSVLNSLIDTFDKNNMRHLNGYSRDILKAPFLIQSFLDDNIDNNNVMELLYEDLVRNPEQEVKKIYSCLDLPFSIDVLNYSKNDKYKGGFNDPKGKAKHNQPVSTSLDLWKKKLEDPRWESFFKGYSYYLGSEFLQKFGDYTNIGFKKTRKFEAYRFASENNLFSNSLSKKLIFKLFLYEKFGIKTF